MSAVRPRADDEEVLLRLHADDLEVLSLTGRAVAATSSLAPELTIRCGGGADGGCRRPIAWAGQTPHGPLYMSSWMVPVAAEVAVDGKRPTRRTYDRQLRQYAEVEGQLDLEEPHGAVALVVLPSALEQDFPDLLARCNKHGDAVLDRVEVIERLRHGGSWAVRVELPHCDYVAPSVDWQEFGVPGYDRNEYRTATFKFGRP